MKTRPLSLSQRMKRLPPSRSTFTSLSFWAYPARMAATATAQAPVPQARVSPDPRSHTRMSRSFSPQTSTNSVLVRWGRNRG